jgi:subtilisin family serine protease
MFMREEDLEAVQGVLSEQSVSGRVVVGSAEEDQIDTLRRAGLFIYRVDPESGPPLPTQVSVPPAQPRPSATRGGERGAESAPAEPQLPAATDVYLVSVAGPLMPSWATELDAAGAEVLERIADTAYACRILLGDVDAVSALPFVSDLRLYRAEDTLHTEQLGGTTRRRLRTFSVEDSRGAPPAEDLVSYDLVLHSPDGADTVIEWLGDHGMELVGAVARKIRFRTERGGPELVQLARLPQVAAIDEWVPPTLSNDRARILLGVEGGDGAPPLKWTGKNQRVAVADSGIDKTHPDFDGRLARIFALGVPGDPRDRHGHGTHVAGSIAGDGPTIKGTAPGAELVFQAIMDANGELGGLPFDLGILFDQARQQGARIHNNSWGALAGGAYRTTSLEVDSYVHEHPDMLVVVAAGNHGTASNPRNAERGFVDLFSVDAPATAKNALTVGASRSDRAWNPPITWAQFDVDRFADSPIGEGLVSGDPTGLAAFSGRGPCAEIVRIKPDVVAPGTFILSTRASTAPDESYWAPKDDRYAYMGGTSMATPLVSGCAAVVREYLVTERDHQPSAALMKAMLVNGTRWLGGPDAVADNRFEPNYHQGFGMVDLRTTLPGPGLARLEFADGWQDDASALSFTGDSRTFVVTCSGGTLRLCLAWTDLPGRGLQNSLAMLVANDALGERTSGNPRRKKQFDTDDAGNNVQVIRFDNAAAGSYVIQVTAANLLPRSAGTTAPPQHFALVASGDITSGLTTL